MGWVTNEQLERARLIPVLDYVLSYESGDYKRVGRGYRLRTDDALAVDENSWYCHKRCMGSRTALDYLSISKAMDWLTRYAGFWVKARRNKAIA